MDDRNSERRQRRQLQKILRSHSGTLKRWENYESPVMQFGIYKGMRASSIPADYFIFLFDNNKIFGRVLQYINQHEAELRAKAEKINGKKK